MSTDRRTSYNGRAWALKVADDGKVLSVHHFFDEETRDGWVMMDPESRLPVDRSHKAVRSWLGVDQPGMIYRIWARIRSIFA